MMTIAHGGLRHLCQQRLSVTQQSMMQRTDALKFPFQNSAVQSVGMAGALYQCPVRHRFAPHEQRHSDNAIIADYSDFGRCAIFHNVQQGHD